MATLYYRPYTTDLNTDSAETPAPNREKESGHVPGYYPDYILGGEPPAPPQPAQAPTARAAIEAAPRPEEGDERYRVAVQRMGQDILSLRQRSQGLEQENRSLRHNLHSDADSNKILLDSVELDGLPKSELVGRYSKCTLMQSLVQ